MRSRRGFTLVELLVAVVVLTIVLGGIYNLLLNTQRVSRAQAEQMDMQSNMRAGTLIVPGELREIGFDSVLAPVGVPPLSNAGSIAGMSSDILEMGPSRIRLRAVRGSGIICVVGANTLTISMAKNFSGNRMARIGDGVTIFVDRDVTTGFDDRWISRTITNVTTVGAVCPGGPWAGAAVQVAVPAFAVAGDPVAAAEITVGSPARLYEVIEYSLYVDGADGRNYLGAESISAGGGRQPVLGPLAANGFNLDYLNQNNVEINCPAPCSGGSLSADMVLRRAVRTIRVTVASVSEENVSPAGTSNNRQLVDSVVTLVALRNAVPR
ncbi:MAG: prepilin-type N-terminal cleavage/methylation domain-containing protein [Gemmatimonadales bacterium]